MNVAIEASFRNLIDKFHAAREAFESLRLTAIEDRPLRDEVLLVERLGNAVEDLRGWLEEAAAAAGDAQTAVRHPLDGYSARAALALANERFLRLEYKFFSEHGSYEEINELTAFGRRHGREWLGWTGSVIQAFAQCRTPLREADGALLLCWQELSERLGASTVSVQTTNIGQQITETVPDALASTRSVQRRPAARRDLSAAAPE
jgi:hypothetical protein